MAVGFAAAAFAGDQSDFPFDILGCDASEDLWNVARD
jgi:hypothetical protein